MDAQLPLRTFLDVLAPDGPEAIWPWGLQLNELTAADVPGDGIRFESNGREWHVTQIDTADDDIGGPSHRGEAQMRDAARVLPPVCFAPLVSQYARLLRDPRWEVHDVPRMMEAMLHDPTLFQLMDTNPLSTFSDSRVTAMTRWWGAVAKPLLGYANNAGRPLLSLIDDYGPLDAESLRDDVPDGDVHSQPMQCASSSSQGTEDGAGNSRDNIPVSAAVSPQMPLEEVRQGYRDVKAVLTLIAATSAPYRCSRPPNAYISGCSARLVFCKDPSTIYLGLLLNTVLRGLPQKVMGSMSVFHLIAEGWGSSPSFASILRACWEAYLQLLQEIRLLLGAPASSTTTSTASAPPARATSRPQLFPALRFPALASRHMSARSHQQQQQQRSGGGRSSTAASPTSGDGAASRWGSSLRQTRVGHDGRMQAVEIGIPMRSAHPRGLQEDEMREEGEGGRRSTGSDTNIGGSIVTALLGGVIRSLSGVSMRQQTESPSVAYHHYNRSTTVETTGNGSGNTVDGGASAPFLTEDAHAICHESMHESSQTPELLLWWARCRLLAYELLDSSSRASVESTNALYFFRELWGVVPLLREILEDDQDSFLAASLPRCGAAGETKDAGKDSAEHRKATRLTFLQRRAKRLYATLIGAVADLSKFWFAIRVNQSAVNAVVSSAPETNAVWSIVNATVPSRRRFHREVFSTFLEHWQYALLVDDYVTQPMYFRVSTRGRTMVTQLLHVLSTYPDFYPALVTRTLAVLNRREMVAANLNEQLVAAVARCLRFYLPPMPAVLAVQPVTTTTTTSGVVAGASVPPIAASEAPGTTTENVLAVATASAPDNLSEPSSLDFPSVSSDAESVEGHAHPLPTSVTEDMGEGQGERAGEPEGATVRGRGGSGSTPMASVVPPNATVAAGDTDDRSDGGSSGSGENAASTSKDFDYEACIFVEEEEDGAPLGLAQDAEGDDTSDSAALQPNREARQQRRMQAELAQMPVITVKAYDAILTCLEVLRMLVRHAHVSVNPMSLLFALPEAAQPAGHHRSGALSSVVPSSASPDLSINPAACAPPSALAHRRQREEEISSVPTAGSSYAAVLPKSQCDLYTLLHQLVYQMRYGPLASAALRFFSACVHYNVRDMVPIFAERGLLNTVLAIARRPLPSTAVHNRTLAPLLFALEGDGGNVDVPPHSLSMSPSSLQLAHANENDRLLLRHPTPEMLRCYIPAEDAHLNALAVRMVLPEFVEAMTVHKATHGVFTKHTEWLTTLPKGLTVTPDMSAVLEGELEAMFDDVQETAPDADGGVDSGGAPASASAASPASPTSDLVFSNAVEHPELWRNREERQLRCRSSPAYAKLLRELTAARRAARSLRSDTGTRDTSCGAGALSSSAGNAGAGLVLPRPPARNQRPGIPALNDTAEDPHMDGVLIRVMELQRLHLKQEDANFRALQGAARETQRVLTEVLQSSSLIEDCLGPSLRTEVASLNRHTHSFVMSVHRSAHRQSSPLFCEQHGSHGVTPVGSLHADESDPFPHHHELLPLLVQLTQLCRTFNNFFAFFAALEWDAHQRRPRLSRRNAEQQASQQEVVTVLESTVKDFHAAVSQLWSLMGSFAFFPIHRRAGKDDSNRVGNEEEGEGGGARRGRSVVGRQVDEGHQGACSLPLKNPLQVYEQGTVDGGSSLLSYVQVTIGSLLHARILGDYFRSTPPSSHLEQSLRSTVQCIFNFSSRDFYAMIGLPLGDRDTSSTPAMVDFNSMDTQSFRAARRRCIRIMRRALEGGPPSLRQRDHRPSWPSSDLAVREPTAGDESSTVGEDEQQREAAAGMEEDEEDGGEERRVAEGYRTAGAFTSAATAVEVEERGERVRLSSTDSPRGDIVSSVLRPLSLGDGAFLRQLLEAWRLSMSGPSGGGGGLSRRDSDSSPWRRVFHDLVGSVVDAVVVQAPYTSDNVRTLQSCLHSGSQSGSSTSMGILSPYDRAVEAGTGTMAATRDEENGAGSGEDFAEVEPADRLLQSMLQDTRGLLLDPATAWMTADAWTQVTASSLTGAPAVPTSAGAATRTTAAAPEETVRGTPGAAAPSPQPREGASEWRAASGAAVAVAETIGAPSHSAFTADSVPSRRHWDGNRRGVTPVVESEESSGSSAILDFSSQTFHRPSTHPARRGGTPLTADAANPGGPTSDSSGSRVESGTSPLPAAAAQVAGTLGRTPPLFVPINAAAALQRWAFLSLFAGRRAVDQTTRNFFYLSPYRRDGHTRPTLPLNVKVLLRHIRTDLQMAFEGAVHVASGASKRRSLSSPRRLQEDQWSPSRQDVAADELQKLGHPTSRREIRDDVTREGAPPAHTVCKWLSMRPRELVNVGLPNDLDVARCLVAIDFVAARRVMWRLAVLGALYSGAGGGGGSGGASNGAGSSLELDSEPLHEMLNRATQLIILLSRLIFTSDTDSSSSSSSTPLSALTSVSTTSGACVPLAAVKPRLSPRMSASKDRLQRTLVYLVVLIMNFLESNNARMRGQHGIHIESLLHCLLDVWPTLPGFPMVPHVYVTAMEAMAQLRPEILNKVSLKGLAAAWRDDVEGVRAMGPATSAADNYHDDVTGATGAGTAEATAREGRSGSLVGDEGYGSRSMVATEDEARVSATLRIRPTRGPQERNGVEEADGGAEMVGNDRLGSASAHTPVIAQSRVRGLPASTTRRPSGDPIDAGATAAAAASRNTNGESASGTAHWQPVQVQERTGRTAASGFRPPLSSVSLHSESSAWGRMLPWVCDVAAGRVFPLETLTLSGQQLLRKRACRALWGLWTSTDTAEQQYVLAYMFHCVMSDARGYVRLLEYIGVLLTQLRAVVLVEALALHHLPRAIVDVVRRAIEDVKAEQLEENRQQQQQETFYNGCDTTTAAAVAKRQHRLRRRRFFVRTQETLFGQLVNFLSVFQNVRNDAPLALDTLSRNTAVTSLADSTAAPCSYFDATRNLFCWNGHQCHRAHIVPASGFRGRDGEDHRFGLNTFGPGTQRAVDEIVSVLVHHGYGGHQATEVPTLARGEAANERGILGRLAEREVFAPVADDESHSSSSPSRMMPSRVAPTHRSPEQGHRSPSRGSALAAEGSRHRAVHSTGLMRRERGTEIVSPNVQAVTEEGGSAARGSEQDSSVLNGGEDQHVRGSVQADASLSPTLSRRVAQGPTDAPMLSAPLPRYGGAQGPRIGEPLRRLRLQEHPSPLASLQLDRMGPPARDEARDTAGSRSTPYSDLMEHGVGTLEANRRERPQLRNRLSNPLLCPYARAHPLLHAIVPHCALFSSDVCEEVLRLSIDFMASQLRNEAAEKADMQVILQDEQQQQQQRLREAPPSQAAGGASSSAAEDGSRPFELPPAASSQSPCTPSASLMYPDRLLGESPVATAGVADSSFAAAAAAARAAAQLTLPRVEVVECGVREVIVHFLLICFSSYYATCMHVLHTYCPASDEVVFLPSPTSSIAILDASVAAIPADALSVVSAFVTHPDAVNRVRSAQLCRLLLSDMPRLEDELWCNMVKVLQATVQTHRAGRHLTEKAYAALAACHLRRTRSLDSPRTTSPLQPPRREGSTLTRMKKDVVYRRECEGAVLSQQDLHHSTGARSPSQRGTLTSSHPPLPTLAGPEVPMHRDPLKSIDELKSDGGHHHRRNGDDPHRFVVPISVFLANLESCMASNPVAFFRSFQRHCEVRWVRAVEGEIPAAWLGVWVEPRTRAGARRASGYGRSCSLCGAPSSRSSASPATTRDFEDRVQHFAQYLTQHTTTGLTGAVAHGACMLATIVQQPGVCAAILSPRFRMSVPAAYAEFLQSTSDLQNNPTDAGMAELAVKEAMAAAPAPEGHDGLEPPPPPARASSSSSSERITVPPFLALSLYFCSALGEAGRRVSGGGGAGTFSHLYGGVDFATALFEHDPIGTSNAVLRALEQLVAALEDITVLTATIPEAVRSRDGAAAEQVDTTAREAPSGRTDAVAAVPPTTEPQDSLAPREEQPEYTAILVRANRVRKALTRCLHNVLCFLDRGSPQPAMEVIPPRQRVSEQHAETNNEVEEAFLTFFDHLSRRGFLHLLFRVTRLQSCEHGRDATSLLQLLSHSLLACGSLKLAQMLTPEQLRYVAELRAAQGLDPCSTPSTSHNASWGTAEQGDGDDLVVSGVPPAIDHELSHDVEQAAPHHPRGSPPTHHRDRTTTTTTTAAAAAAFSEGERAVDERPTDPIVTTVGPLSSPPILEVEEFDGMRSDVQSSRPSAGATHDLVDTADRYENEQEQQASLGRDPEAPTVEGALQPGMPAPAHQRGAASHLPHADAISTAAAAARRTSPLPPAAQADNHNEEGGTSVSLTLRSYEDALWRAISGAHRLHTPRDREGARETINFESVGGEDHDGDFIEAEEPAHMTEMEDLVEMVREDDNAPRVLRMSASVTEVDIMNEEDSDAAHSFHSHPVISVVTSWRAVTPPWGLDEGGDDGAEGEEGEEEEGDGFDDPENYEDDDDAEEEGVNDDAEEEEAEEDDEDEEGEGDEEEEADEGSTVYDLQEGDMTQFYSHFIDGDWSRLMDRGAPSRRIHDIAAATAFGYSDQASRYAVPLELNAFGRAPGSAGGSERAPSLAACAYRAIVLAVQPIASYNTVEVDPPLSPVLRASEEIVPVPTPASMPAATARAPMPHGAAGPLQQPVRQRRDFSSPHAPPSVVEQTPSDQLMRRDRDSRSPLVSASTTGPALRGQESQQPHTEGHGHSGVVRRRVTRITDTQQRSRSPPVASASTLRLTGDMEAAAGEETAAVVGPDSAPPVPTDTSLAALTARILALFEEGNSGARDGAAVSPSSPVPQPSLPSAALLATAAPSAQLGNSPADPVAPVSSRPSVLPPLPPASVSAEATAAEPWEGTVDPHFLTEMPMDVRSEIIFDHMLLLRSAEEREVLGRRSRLYPRFLNAFPEDAQRHAMDVEERWVRVTGADNEANELYQTLLNVDAETRRDLLIQCDWDLLRAFPELLHEAAELRAEAERARQATERAVEETEQARRRDQERHRVARERAQIPPFLPQTLAREHQRMWTPGAWNIMRDAPSIAMDDRGSIAAAPSPSIGAVTDIRSGVPILREMASVDGVMRVLFGPTGQLYEVVSYELSLARQYYQCEAVLQVHTSPLQSLSLSAAVHRQRAVAAAGLDAAGLLSSPLRDEVELHATGLTRHRRHRRTLFRGDVRAPPLPQSRFSDDDHHRLPSLPLLPPPVTVDAASVEMPASPSTPSVPLAPTQAEEDASTTPEARPLELVASPSRTAYRQHMITAAAWSLSMLPVQASSHFSGALPIPTVPQDVVMRCVELLRLRSTAALVQPCNQLTGFSYLDQELLRLMRLLMSDISSAARMVCLLLDMMASTQTKMPSEKELSREAAVGGQPLSSTDCAGVASSRAPTLPALPRVLSSSELAANRQFIKDAITMLITLTRYSQFTVLAFLFVPDGAMDSATVKPVDAPATPEEEVVVRYGLWNRLWKVAREHAHVPTFMQSFDKLLEHLLRAYGGLCTAVPAVDPLNGEDPEAFEDLSDTLITHPRHAHRLRWMNIRSFRSYEESGFLCNLCGVNTGSDFSFHCSACQYDLCANCSRVRLTQVESQQRARRAAALMLEEVPETVTSMMQLLRHPLCRRDIAAAVVKLMSPGLRECGAVSSPSLTATAMSGTTPTTSTFSRFDSALGRSGSGNAAPGPLQLLEQELVALAEARVRALKVARDEFREEVRCILHPVPRSAAAAMGSRDAQTINDGSPLTTAATITTTTVSRNNTWQQLCIPEGYIFDTDTVMALLVKLDAKDSEGDSIQLLFEPYVATMRAEPRAFTMLWRASQAYLLDVSTLLEHVAPREVLPLPSCVSSILQTFCRYHLSEPQLLSASASARTLTGSRSNLSGETEHFLQASTKPSSVSDRAVRELAAQPDAAQWLTAAGTRLSDEGLKTADELQQRRLPRSVRKVLEENRATLNALLHWDANLLKENFAFLKYEPNLIDFSFKLADFRRRLSMRRGANILLRVNRQTCLLDSFKELQKVRSFSGQLHIRFQGEEGADAGGLTREWLRIICEAVVDASYALFIHSQDGMSFQPNPFSSINPNHLEYFQFVGVVVGLAMSHNVPIDIHFPRAFYRHLIGHRPVFADLQSFDAELYANLNWIIENDVTDLGLTFAVNYSRFGSMEEEELEPHGKDKAVTNENKQQYVRLLCEFHMTKRTEDQLLRFLKGFYSVVPRREIQCFSENELELVISGMPDIDIEDLRAHTVYEGYSSTSPQVRWFWEAVGSMTKEDLANLLQFATGSSKVPHGGFEHLEGTNGRSLPFTISRWAVAKEDLLPQAHTCFNKIDLPVYNSAAILKERLMLAITYGSMGFTMV